MAYLSFHSCPLSLLSHCGNYYEHKCSTSSATKVMSIHIVCPEHSGYNLCLCINFLLNCNKLPKCNGLKQHSFNISQFSWVKNPGTASLGSQCHDLTVLWATCWLSCVLFWSLGISFQAPMFIGKTHFLPLWN